MQCQQREIGNGQCSEFCSVTDLAASLALMGLLAGVDTLMNRQGRPLDELFVAAWEFTYVRTNTTVDTFCDIYRSVQVP